MQALPKWCAPTAVLLTILLLAGCGSTVQPMTVNGKLVAPSNLKLEETDSIVVTFSPVEGSSASGGTGTASPKDLSFTAKVPPGKYRVAVTFEPYAGTKDAERRAKDLSQRVGMYNAAATALRYEVTTDPVQNITIDLVKGTVTKN